MNLEHHCLLSGVLDPETRAMNSAPQQEPFKWSLSTEGGIPTLGALGTDLMLSNHHGEVLWCKERLGGGFVPVWSSQQWEKQPRNPWKDLISSRITGTSTSRNYHWLERAKEEEKDGLDRWWLTSKGLRCEVAGKRQMQTWNEETAKNDSC